MGLMIIFSILQAVFGIVVLLVIESRIFPKLKSNCCQRATIGDSEQAFLNEVLKN